MRACALPGAGVSAHLRLPGHLRWRGCSGPRDASTMYGNPFFSVQEVACTEIISFPYSSPAIRRESQAGMSGYGY